MPRESVVLARQGPGSARGHAPPQSVKAATDPTMYGFPRSRQGPPGRPDARRALFPIRSHRLQTPIYFPGSPMLMV
jgi:hypothetical protein